MTRSKRPRLARRAEAIALVLTLLLFGCPKEDRGGEHYEKALTLHRALVDQGQLPSSSKYDAVIAELDQIEPDSKFAGRGKQLKTAIVRGRGKPLGEPLAARHSDEANIEPSVLREMKACEALAVELANDGGATAENVKALDACRTRVKQAQERVHHAEDHP